MELLGSGREADVYALDTGRVLRRYRSGADAGPEAELMAHLHGLGFPVPLVHDVSGPDLVMERLDGPTMADGGGALSGVDPADGGGALRAVDPADGVAAPGGSLGAAASLLAGLQRRLHALPARIGLRDGDRILHRDLHPENVMITSHGPVVIDWHNAAEGAPAVDVCLTAIILAQVAADTGHPRAGVAGAFLTAFLAEIDGGSLSALDEAIEIRRQDPALSADEAARLADIVVPLIGVVRQPPV